MSLPPSNLLDLLDRSSARVILAQPGQNLGLAEVAPFPFAALVGQLEMKTALLLSLINPHIGGLLLIGPRGTGKTTAVRSLVDLLPQVPRSLCQYGCTEEAIQDGGMDAVCPACAERFGHGEPLSALDRVRLIELPLNSRIEDVVGGINERVAVEQHRIRLERGILAQADQNILYVDEVNLLDDSVVNAILDAAAQGRYTVRRGPLRLAYRARLTLIGSMNPEEGRLRPQIMDRFGLRLIVRGLKESDGRLEIYRRSRAYRENPHAMIAQWAEETLSITDEIGRARELLPTVTLERAATQLGLNLIDKLQLPSHRSEFTLFEAARAYAAADGRTTATQADIAVVAPMSLRLRRSLFIKEFLHEQQGEEEEIQRMVQECAERPDSTRENS